MEQLMCGLCNKLSKCDVDTLNRASFLLALFFIEVNRVMCLVGE